MHSFCNSTPPFSILSRPSLLRYVSRKFFSKFDWPFGMMGKGRISIESSRAEGFSAGDGSCSATCKFIRRDLSTETRSMSNTVPSSETTIDSGKTNLPIARTYVDALGVSSVSLRSESNNLNLDEGSANIVRHRDNSSFPGNSGKKDRVACGHRPQSAHRISNNAIAGRQFEPYNIKPFDICQRRRQNIGLQEGATEKRILRPGMVLLKNYLSHYKQVELVNVCRKLGLGPGGFYRPRYESGAKLRLQMMCLGLDWDPQTRKYSKKRSIDGSEPPKIPNEFRNLAKMAVQDAQFLSKEEFRVRNVENVLPSMSPDICIVNFYTANGRLGLHQDRDESRESLSRGLPVVSFSVGDSAEFLYGDQRDVDKAEKVLLESGDVLIFGGESRDVFHGVSSIIPNSAPQFLLEDTGLRPGRLNLTFRKF